MRHSDGMSGSDRAWRGSRPRRARLVTMLLAVAAVSRLAGCACAHAAAPEDGDVRRTLTVGDRERSYELHLPRTFDATQATALVVVLHGGGGNAASAGKQTGFSAVADREGFIVAYPNGSGRLGERLLTWNAGTCCGYAVSHQVDDVAFVRAMVAQIEAEHRIDPKRVYATGISNGGMMSYRLACEASDVFAAIGPVSAVQIAPSCVPTAPVSVLHVHGTADRNVPLDGGVGSRALNRDRRPPVHESVDFWVHADRCSPEPAVDQSGTVRHERWTGCAPGTEVDFYTITGGGHAWPGGERMLAVLDQPSDAISATPLLWKFFAEHPKP